MVIGGFQFDKKIEHHVEHLVWARVFSVDLINNDDRLEAVLHRLAQDKARLRLRPVVRVDHEQNPVDHFHDPLDFAAEIGVPWCIDNVDAIAVPMKGGILGADGDSLFALQIHRIHHALFNFLI